MKGLLVAVVVLHLAQFGLGATASDIVRVARSYIGSRTWLQSAYHDIGGYGTNKCNLFVADVLKEAGAPAPNRKFWEYSPIGANEWGSSYSMYLGILSGCWSLCSGGIQPGDVIAIPHSGSSGHVGIVTGQRQTTSASYPATPRGLVVENDWGFRSGQHPTCWRYEYSSC